MPGLLSRVARYLPSHIGNPGENRLTEVTAAVLERHSELAYEFCAALAETDAGFLTHLAAVRQQGPEVRVGTQLVREGRAIDMAIRVCPDALRRQQDLLIWVEVKHGADISGDQLVEYERLLPQEQAARRLLVILAPAQHPPNQDTRGLPVVFWQNVLTRCAQRAVRGAPGSAHRLLFDEFYDYCAQEMLMPATPLTVHSAAALAGRRQAARTAEALCELCHEQVLTRFEYDGARGGNKQPQYGTSFWATHRLPRAQGSHELDPAWQGAWLEWGLRHDHSLGEGSRDAFAFVAGVTFRKSQPSPPAKHPEWLTRRSSDGYVHTRHDGWERLWSYRYPESLLIASTLEAQAAKLSGWVIERFETLVADPPG